MTIEEFRSKLIALIEQAIKEGLYIDDVLAVAEYVIENVQFSE